MNTREEVYNIFNSYRDYININHVWFYEDFVLISDDLSKINDINYSIYTINFSFLEKEVDVFVDFLKEIFRKRDNICHLIIMRCGAYQNYFFIELYMDVNDE